MTHIVTSYASELETLSSSVTQMGGLVEAQLSDVMDAVARRDLALARKVIDLDARIDVYNHEIEADVMNLLALRQPVAIDLRETVCAMKIAHELERIGDLAKNIAKRALVISQQEPLRALNGVIRMGRISLMRVSDVLNAYAQRNVAQAKSVWGADDEIDELYNSLFAEILSAMMEDASAVNACTQLAFVAKNFERVGDHATNIAESVHFLLVGEYLDELRPKGDVTSLTTVPKPDDKAPDPEDKEQP
ncbi:MAG: phosphate signaling complex protein PhoU [Pseudomonadota bacterium]